MTRNRLSLSLLSGVLCGLALLSSLSAVAASGLAPLPRPPALDSVKVELGKMLFFETRLSGDGSISCASCHNPDKTWADGIALSAGYPASLYFRNTPTVLNTVHKKFLYWDGRISGDDLATLVRDHISEAHFMQADGRLVIERLRQIPEYEKKFNEAFGGEPSYGKILNGVAEFVRSLNSIDAPIDRYLAGEREAISVDARKGEKLFTGKAQCVKCHGGFMFTDEAFHALGLPENADVFVDPLRHITFRRFFKTFGVEGYHELRRDVGVYAITKDPQDRGKFKTPSLREVAKTAPYMHNGVLETLEDVVEFYNRGGGNESLKPLGLSSDEKANLVAFLGALAGADVKVAPPPRLEYQIRKLGEN